MAAGCYRDAAMAVIRIQAEKLHVQESVEDVHQRVANADTGVHRAGRQVTASGWITLTDADADASTPNREIYVQVSQIGYVREDG
jgi:hypothetical protein